MNRFLLTIIAVLCYCAVGNAEQLREQDARSIAKSFFADKTEQGILKLVNTDLHLAYKSKNKITGVEGAYYVFNRGARDGYVVVAGDDAVATPVLGYSENGTFDYEKIPENMRYWLDEYQRQIEYLQEKGVESSSVAPKEWTTSVAPLLGEIKWGQDAPYNLMCPTLSNGNKAAAGCVATAMAQIMYYWRWPEVGVGSNSYEWEYNNTKTVLSADFSKSTYQWDLMQPTYNKESSVESQQAVAKLLSDVGISVNMSYNTSSGASSVLARKALINYFKYQAKMNYRTNYLSDEWEQLLKKELDEGRPIYYSGHDSYHSGHAFVCDGYNKDGYFHFNWGWTGTCDGYFLLTSLSPTQVEEEGYTINQTIITNVSPDEGVEYEEDWYVKLDRWEISISEVAVGNKAQVDMWGMWNMSTDTLPLEFSLNMYKGEELVKKTTIVKREVTPPGMGLGGAYVKPYFSPGLEEGEYRLYPQYKLIHEPDSAFKNMHMERVIPNYINVLIKDRKVTLSFPNNLQYSLKLKALNAGTVIGTNRKLYPVATIQNTGDLEYYGIMRMRVLDMSDNELSVSLPKMVFLKSGETIELKCELDAIATEGSYKICVYDEENKLIGVKGIYVQTMSDANLSIAKQIEPKSTEMTPSDIEVTANIANSGDYYEGDLELMIYGDNRIYRRIYSKVRINKNETETVTFKGSFPEAIIGKEYTMALRRYDVTNKSQVWGKQVKFTLVAEKSAIDDVAEDVVNISLADGVLTVLSKKGIAEVTIYSLSGAIVAQAKSVNEHKVSKDISLLENGLYIVRVVNSDGELKVQKIKK